MRARRFEIGRHRLHAAQEIGEDAAQVAPQSLFDAGVKAQVAWEQTLFASKGQDNPYVLHRLMGKSMSDNVTIIRINSKMRETLALLQGLKDRYRNNLGMPDTGTWTNNTLTFTKALRDMLALAEAITLAAINRNESRGAHFKVPDDKADRHDLSLDERKYPRNDEEWLKTTLVTCKQVPPDQFPTPELSYEPVDVSIVTPVARTYGKTTA